MSCAPVKPYLNVLAARRPQPFIQFCHVSPAVAERVAAAAHQQQRQFRRNTVRPVRRGNHVQQGYYIVIRTGGIVKAVTVHQPANIFISRKPLPAVGGIFHFAAQILAAKLHYMRRAVLAVLVKAHQPRQKLQKLSVFKTVARADQNAPRKVVAVPRYILPCGKAAHTVPHKENGQVGVSFRYDFRQRFSYRGLYSASRCCGRKILHRRRCLRIYRDPKNHLSKPRSHGR